MKAATTVICTAGTSLFFPNLANLKPDDPNPRRSALADAYARKDWGQVALALRALPSTDRTCGAEINSMAGLFAGGYADRGCNLIFPVSATPDGQAIGRVLVSYYQAGGHPLAEAREIVGLQDQDPQAFRTKGLRNLAKVICETVRNYDASCCAINATGGYKAQIAIAVLIGQALGVPVYYKHERFQDHDIIAFPPIPVAFDYSLWMRNQGVLAALEREPQPGDLLDDSSDDREALETLVNRVAIDGVDYVELSATGQIFLETFRDRFRLDQSR